MEMRSRFGFLGNIISEREFMTFFLNPFLERCVQRLNRNGLALRIIQTGFVSMDSRPYSKIGLTIPGPPPVTVLRRHQTTHINIHEGLKVTEIGLIAMSAAGATHSAAHLLN